mmetsp:Transcript_53202/g.147304  ORF Transcript_53202/g.147304 Transcript_53202/m.147304 type:complete len:297 (-) Transcript_53202:134-1024(-)
MMAFTRPSPPEDLMSSTNCAASEYLSRASRAATCKSTSSGCCVIATFVSSMPTWCVKPACCCTSGGQATPHERALKPFVCRATAPLWVCKASVMRCMPLTSAKAVRPAARLPMRLLMASTARSCIAASALWLFIILAQAPMQPASTRRSGNPSRASSADNRLANESQPCGDADAQAGAAAAMKPRAMTSNVATSFVTSCSQSCRSATTRGALPVQAERKNPPTAPKPSRSLALTVRTPVPCPTVSPGSQTSAAIILAAASPANNAVSLNSSLPSIPSSIARNVDVSVMRLRAVSGS